eukprot:8679574-Lingulodinium_polyedra.AAC.1
MHARHRLNSGKAVGGDGANAELLKEFLSEWFLRLYVLLQWRALGKPRDEAWFLAVAHPIPK